MTPTQENASNNNLKKESVIEAISHEETLDYGKLSAEINDKVNQQEEVEQVNGFELFMQNAKGNFGKAIGCGG